MSNLKGQQMKAAKKSARKKPAPLRKGSRVFIRTVDQLEREREQEREPMRINWEAAGKAAAESERKNYGVTPPHARRPPWWRPGMPTLKSTGDGGRISRERVRVARKLDQVLGPVESEGGE